MTMGEFERRVALVTGGALGIGRGICLGFAREGARVAVADVDRDHATELADAIRSSGGEALAVIGDVARADDAARMVRETVAAFGGLDIVVSNAGVQPRLYLRLEDAGSHLDASWSA
jgi:NAD(P)-dependent dehydrogenase (short-subunit alcohol dehydrogenase family)